MSAIVTGYSTPASAAKDYSKGAQKGTFTSYEERAAESGGEVLYGLDKELAERAAELWVSGVSGTATAVQRPTVTP